MDSVLRGAVVYIVLMIIMRLSGRRTLAQVTPFDFILLLIIAETTQQALLGDDFSITNSALLIVTLCTMDILMSFAKSWSTRLALWLDGTPTVLISDGNLDTYALRRARVSLDEVLQAAREQHGLKTLSEIDAAVLEVSGGISIIPKRDS